MKMRFVVEISRVTTKFYKLEVRCNAPDVHSVPCASSSSSEKSESSYGGRKKKHDIKRKRNKKIVTTEKG